MTRHLDMTQLLALRDGDRSEPGVAAARDHMLACAHCQDEVERLHQRTARLRALPSLAPGRNEFPAVQHRVTADRNHRRGRTVAGTVLIAAAAMVIGIIGHDLVHPKPLDAEQQLREAMGRSQQLERELHAWNPDARVVDGGTAMAAIQLERQIADLDAQLAHAAQLDARTGVERELRLWRERVGLMNALVNVQLTQSSKVGL
jgi:hypothetical protein